MQTLTGQNTKAEYSAQEKGVSFGQLGRKIGFFILRLLGALIAFISLIPVALLPFITAVPLTLFLLLAVVDIGLIYLLFARTEGLIAQTTAIAGLIGVSILAILLSQWTATTPPIVDASGQPLPNSIASLERVELNGRDQWITIRGQDINSPVLLFLAGGPGGSQLAATRKKLAGLEEHFVVVNWDQPGAGKSYRAADFDALTVEQYVTDAQALTLYLRERFDEEKIYLFGESWGSLLGMWLIERNPEMFHAFAGTAQMVAFLETDTYDYNLALQIAAENSDTRTLNNLEEQGPPPYYGDGVAMKVTRYIMYLSQYMNQNPAIHHGYDTFGDIAAPEYGLYDKVNFVRGLLRTMENLWSKLWTIDLRRDVPRVEVPVYFLEGRHDVNAPPALVEDYLSTLEAPHKELIWLEHSGHSPWMEEPEKVTETLIDRFLR